MGIIKTISNRVRTMLVKVDESLKDPVADGKIAIEDSKKQIGQFEEKILNLKVHKKSLEKKKDELTKEVAKFEKIAKMAGEAGNEDDLRQALESKQRASDKLNFTKKEIKDNANLLDTLLSNLDAAKNKVRSAEGKIDTLESRMAGAKMRQDLSKANSEFCGGSGLAGIDDLEKNVDEAESKAEAMEELNTSPGDDLEEKYSSGSKNIDDEMQKYLKK